MLHLRRRNARYWRLMAGVGITVARKRRTCKDRINVELLVTILGNDRLETMQAEGDARFAWNSKYDHRIAWRESSFGRVTGVLAVGFDIWHARAISPTGMTPWLVCVSTSTTKSVAANERQFMRDEEQRKTRGTRVGVSLFGSVTWSDRLKAGTAATAVDAATTVVWYFQKGKTLLIFPRATQMPYILPNGDSSLFGKYSQQSELSTTTIIACDCSLLVLSAFVSFDLPVKKNISKA